VLRKAGETPPGEGVRLALPAHANIAVGMVRKKGTVFLTPPPANHVWPLAVYFAAVLVLVAGMMVISYVLGQHHKAPQTDQQYESGIKSTGTARIRWDVKYYEIAMFFVIFDLEAVFLYAWAVAARELGWPGYFEALIFVAVLVAGLIYLWRLGALDWARARRLAPGRARPEAFTAVEPSGVAPLERLPGEPPEVRARTMNV
jgi:NADH-quinone oxidoreductase subunit A